MPAHGITFPLLSQQVVCPVAGKWQDGRLTNRSLKSVALAAPPSRGVTPKISSTVRSVELCVY